MTRSALVVFAIFAASPIRAQELREVHVGDRVRVTLASRIAPAPLIGTVLTVGPDTLAVEREEGGVRKLAASRIVRVEVSVGREYSYGKSVGYSLLAGALALVPLAGVASVIGSENGGRAALYFVVLPVAAVVGVGALMGSGREDVWVEASWPPSTVPIEGAPTDSMLPDAPGTTWP